VRKIRELNAYDVDSQQALRAINEVLDEVGINEDNIISVQHEVIEPPIPMHPGNREGRALIRVFYWVN
jgi:hypothetical protein